MHPHEHHEDSVHNDVWVTDLLTRYREVREALERDTLSLATSIDGRTFELQASLHGLNLARGAYVALETEDGIRLGQVTDLSARTADAEIDVPGASWSTLQLRLAVGRGLLLDRGGSFHDASIRLADRDEIASRLSPARADRAMLTIGELAQAPGVPAELDSGGFNRHTFMCGQSGSGKTYSLGLLLERMLAETNLRVVVLDPNSDYVKLGALHPDADPDLAERYSEVFGDIAVWGDEGADQRLRLRFDQLDAQTQAAVLGLDPLRDRDEYAVLTDLLAVRKDGQPLVTGLGDLADAPSEGARQLGRRASNLGVLDWDVWSQTEPSLLDELTTPTSRCVVVDLGSLATLHEQRLVADAVLSALWARRHTREPVLVVIDEAHNICPAEPDAPLSHLSSGRAVQMAAEGRKYGLYLLVSTQRPGKVHENVVSQCDNLLLMRMNAASDLHELERLFSFVPPGLMAGATAFDMGQALVSGRIFPSGSGYVQMGRRLTQEGGADVPAEWAQTRLS